MYVNATRRQFLSLSGAGAALAFVPMSQLFADDTSAVWSADGGYGPLQAVRDDTTGLPLLKLPAGFHYRSFGWVGDPMADGLLTPSSHDGMAVVAAQGGLLTLIRNHEVTDDRGAFGPFGLTYDKAAGGGTTTLQFDAARGEWVKAWASLSGTLANCCGGPTPWGSWLSCEERVIRPGDQRREGGTEPVLFERDHGYVFEVPAVGNAKPEPLTALGCFAHEAAAVDPGDGTVYLTEDRHPEAGFYRFLPKVAGQLARGGRLEMMKVIGRPDLRAEVPANRDFDVQWVPIEVPERAHTPGTDDASGVINQGLLLGGARFVRLEGCWFDRNRVFFTSTSGGLAGRGQLFCFSPKDQTVRKVYESQGEETLDYPDNITISPNGCVLMCEDGSRSGQMVLALSPAGALFPLVQNDAHLAGERNGLSGDFRTSEWCGACFSPDGRWLFANLQRPGITFAITGPWDKGII